MRCEAWLRVLVFYGFLLFSVAGERIFYINVVSCGGVVGDEERRIERGISTVLTSFDGTIQFSRDSLFFHGLGWC